MFNIFKKLFGKKKEEIKEEIKEEDINPTDNFYKWNAYCRNCQNHVQVKTRKGVKKEGNNHVCPKCGVIGVAEKLSCDNYNLKAPFRDNVKIDKNKTYISYFHCDNCGEESEIQIIWGKTKDEKVTCPKCGCEKI